MDDLKHIMRKNYLLYASYVILDRAIPHIIDGLKPVQRRILHTLFGMDDGKLHKVANVAGQTMAYHPHGDGPITEALVHLANRGYLLDTQGNFGNLYTGDPAAASRYIETRLSELAKETLFNKTITSYQPSYDGRNLEPVCLPAKIPLLLLQGAEGIAVGMSTKIFPHNFTEVLQAQIQILEKKPFCIYPDFPTGGLMDISQYREGNGKIKLRAVVEIVDPKTIVIREICYGTTTESLIRSIDEAAKKGLIKIESIQDYTAGKVEIEIKLLRGHYAADIIDALYAFTDCEVSLSGQVIVIRNHLPLETDVHEILKIHTETLKGFLGKELEIARDDILAKIFEKTLEQIFIENRLYKKIEEIKTYEKIHETIETSLIPFLKKLERKPVYEDREKLLRIPIRRISLFDIQKHRDEIVLLRKNLEEIEKNLKNLTRYTSGYLKNLLKKYGPLFPRKTKIEEIEELNRKKISEREIKIGLDYKTGYIGTKVQATEHLICMSTDKILLFFEDGTYQVIPPPEKEYVIKEHKGLLFAGIADKTTLFSAVYKDPKTKCLYAKRFVVTKFILNKTYSFFKTGMKAEILTSVADPIIHIEFSPKAKSKNVRYALSEVPTKNPSAGGKKIFAKEVKKVTLLSKK